TSDSEEFDQRHNLSSCGLHQQRVPKHHGYWTGYNDANDIPPIWNSLVCQTSQWRNTSKVNQCLRNKKLLLMGDSTTRQWVENLPALILGNYKFDIGKLADVSSLPRVSAQFYKTINFSVNFLFHPHAISKMEISPAVLAKIRYEVEILDTYEIKQCKNTLGILISPWAHFAQWTRHSFEQRLQKLKEAVVRFHSRCPQVPIVLKGPHVRDHRSPESRLYTSDYLLQQMGVLMRELFRETGVWFLDVWDMNLSYPSRKVIHMPGVVVQQELSMFLSYVCDTR
ncbi:NXPE family member 3-like, partial [Amphiura filiformis]|uniref:NXPE family member 3-like n=1 Tax=Amphiura filiformis TaxID=82378 RepID=UPI003B21C152